MNFLAFQIAIPLATLLFVAAGLLILLSGANVKWRDTGKAIFRAAVIGVIIIFTSWIVVNTVIGTLGGSSTPTGFPWPWNAPACGVAVAPPPGPPGVPPPGAPPPPAAITLEEKIDDQSAAMIETLIANPPAFNEPTSKVLSFDCDTYLLPSCGALIDVATIEEYYRVVTEEIFPKVLAAGADPCQIILSVAVTDNTLWKSYDPAQDPQVTQCGG